VIDYRFTVPLNFENFGNLYNGIVSCKVVTGKIESNWIWHWIKSFSSLANCPSLVLIQGQKLKLVHNICWSITTHYAA